MAKTSAKSALLLIGGYNLSTYGSQYEIDYQSNPIEVTGFGDGWKNHIPGIFSGSMNIAAYWDSAAGMSLAALKPLANKQVTYVPEGWVLGNPCFCMSSEQDGIKVNGTPGSAISLGTVSFMTSGIDGGPLPGWILQHGTITNTTTQTGFTDPSGGAVTARCAGFLHIWQACAADTYVVKIRHCATIGGVYSDLVTFTANGSVITSERVNVASGQILQYRQVEATRTGAAGNTFGFSVGFWHA